MASLCTIGMQTCSYDVSERIHDCFLGCGAVKTHVPLEFQGLLLVFGGATVSPGYVGEAGRQNATLCYHVLVVQEGLARLLVRGNSSTS